MTKEQMLEKITELQKYAELHQALMHVNCRGSKDVQERVYRTVPVAKKQIEDIKSKIEELEQDKPTLGKISREYKDKLTDLVGNRGKKTNATTREGSAPLLSRITSFSKSKKHLQADLRDAQARLAEAKEISPVSAIILMDNIRALGSLVGNDLRFTDESRKMIEQYEYSPILDNGEINTNANNFIKKGDKAEVDPVYGKVERKRYYAVDVICGMRDAAKRQRNFVSGMESTRLTSSPESVFDVCAEILNPDSALMSKLRRSAGLKESLWNQQGALVSQYVGNSVHSGSKHGSTVSYQMVWDIIAGKYSDNASQETTASDGKTI